MFITIFREAIREIKDERDESKIRYSVGEILLLSFCAILSGCETYGEIEEYGKNKCDFLRRFLPYLNGIPNETTLERVFRWLDPSHLTGILIRFAQDVSPDLAERLIAMDGKTPLRLKGRRQEGHTRRQRVRSGIGIDAGALESRRQKQ